MRNFFPNYQPIKTVSPTSPAEVQEIIKQANVDRIPLVPVSSGTNLQDTHLPSVKNATTVDLSKMNRILYFDAKNRNAVIEPGVSFAQLEEVCKKEGLRTLPAIDVSKEASVLGTYLEMMPLYAWPKYHPWEMLTMSGFRADGEPFATGQMAMTQKRPDKYSWGVSFAQVARLFCQAQGTLGIITAAAVTLKTATPKNQVLFFACRNINQVTKALKTFVATEELHEVFAVNKIYLEDFLGQQSATALPPWTVVLVIRGFENEELAYKRKDLKELAAQLGGELTTGCNGYKKAGEKILTELQSPSGSSRHSYKGNGWVPLVTVATARQIKECSPLFGKASGVILMPLQAGGCFYYQPDLRYTIDRLPETRKHYVAICSRLLQAGIMLPRPSVPVSKRVAACYPDNHALLKSIKRAVDPANIMNPGKLGL